MQLGGAKSLKETNTVQNQKRHPNEFCIGILRTELLLILVRTLRWIFKLQIQVGKLKKKKKTLNKLKIIFAMRTYPSFRWQDLDNQQIGLFSSSINVLLHFSAKDLARDFFKSLN